MIPFLLIVFVIVCIFVYTEEYIEDVKWSVYVAIAIALILIAGLRVVGNDDDSENYQIMFDRYDDTLIRLTTEPSFILISSFVHSIKGDIHTLFFIYAVIAITMKFVAFKQLSPMLFASVMVYVSHFFILHDMIEIRVSVAIGFFLLSIKPMCEGKKKKAFLFLLMALFFHYSSLVLFGLLFLSNNPLSSAWKWVLASIVPLGYVMFFLHIDLLTTIPIPVIGQKLELYRDMKEIGMFDEIYVFKNPTLLIKILCFYVLLFYHDVLCQKCSYLPLLMKTMGISLFCFFAFSSLPVLSGRLYELFGAIDIITIALVIYVLEPKYVAKTMVLLLCSIMLFMDVFVYELIR